MSDISDILAREERVDQILADYLLALETGKNCDEALWLQKHAEFAEELREFFADKRRMDEIVSQPALWARNPPTGC